MSQLNGLGPNNQGPMTGRGLGRCNGGFGGRGRGLGFGAGRGMGFGRTFFTKKETKEDLEAYKKELEAEISAINEELGSN